MIRTRSVVGTVLAVGFACALLGAPRAAAAQTIEQGLSLNRFDPAVRGSEWFANDTLDLRGHLRPTVGVVMEGQYRPLVLANANGDVKWSPLRNVGTLHVGASFVFFQRLRFALDVPIVVFQDGHQATLGRSTIVAPESDQAFGDFRFTTDFRVFGTYGDPFTLAAGIGIYFPSGSTRDYTGDGTLRFAPRLLVAGDVGPFVYSARIGANLGRPERFFGATRVGQEFTWAAAAGVRVLNRHLVVGPEVFGSAVFTSNPSQASVSGLPEDTGPETPVEVLLGAHYTAGPVRFGLGGGFGLTRGFGSPERRWMVSLEIAPPFRDDTDGDGIADEKDACPTVAGVASDDGRKNGCPADGDGDGVPDAEDACPRVPGPRSLEKATNGCPTEPVAALQPPPPPPPADADGDGVRDEVDACPAVAGVASDDPKKNGCPPDKDGDGVLDKDDACVDQPGPHSTKPELDGCPVDLDGDGIENEKDACPREAGKANADPAKNGCPMAFVQGGVITILEQVKFKTGSADILPGKDSEDVLGAVLGVLKSHPDITKLSVEGHTDDQGPAAYNKKLSADRAASVVKWLVAHGIDKARLTSAGFGPDRPLQPNTTDAGRKANRRVEFHIEK
jgi:outer membrane protein OmpA-like peptidoglycan-associated protein